MAHWEYHGVHQAPLRSRRRTCSKATDPAQFLRPANSVHGRVHALWYAAAPAHGAGGPLSTRCLMIKPVHNSPGDPTRGHNPGLDSTAPATPAKRVILAAGDIPFPPPVYPGARVLNYIVEQMIGEGGMGAVWRVRQKMLKVPRAMKVLKPGSASVERFEEEMEMLAMVKHDNVVKVIDSGVLPDGSLFYVMELVEGRSLEADIEKHRGRRPHWEYIREIILQICDGLSAIHDRGIIHRDMKPANCMLTPDVNETVHVKIVDLGVARRSSVARLGSTSDGMFIGSAAYASPEQAAGETKNLTYGSDVYSVGIILYELLTGTIPHIADGSIDRAAMLRRRVIGTLPQPPSLHMRPGTLPPEIDEIIVRALQPDPRDRFQTVSELAEAIRQTPALPRQLRRTTRPSQSLSQVRADIFVDEDSSPSMFSSQSSSGLKPIHPQHSAHSAHPQHSSGTSSPNIAIPPTFPPSQSSSSGLRAPQASTSSPGSKTFPPSQSGSNLTPLPSQSSPGLGPVSAQAHDISTLVAARPSRRPPRAALIAGAVVLVAGLLAIPAVRHRLFGTTEIILPFVTEEPPLFTRARTAIQRLGLQEAQDVQVGLQQLADDTTQSAEFIATARLLEAELVLMRALACQISVHLDPEPGTCRVHVQADPARAVLLLDQVPPEHAPAPQARVRAILRLVQGEPVDDPALAPQDRDELQALAGAAPMWRNGPAVPADLIPPLQELKTPSTLVRSVLALGLWRSGEDPQAARLLTATLKMADDQPAARAIWDALLRSHDGEPVPIHPPTPIEEPPQPTTQPTTPPDAADPTAPPSKTPRPVAPPPEKFASLEQQIDVGCARVQKGDRTGVRVLKDALSQGAVFETDFNLCYCLGQGFAAEKTYDAALVWFIRALAIDPNHRNSLSGAAYAAQQLGRKDRAVELYRRLHEVDPNDPVAAAYLNTHDPPPGPLMTKGKKDEQPTEKVDKPEKDGAGVEDAAEAQPSADPPVEPAPG